MVGRDAVPCAQLLHAYAEAVCDSDQRVAATERVALLPDGVAGGGDGDDEFIAGADWFGCGDSVDGGDLGWAGMQRSGDVAKCLAVLDDVEAPTVSLILGDVLEAV